MTQIKLDTWGVVFDDTQLYPIIAAGIVISQNIDGSPAITFSGWPLVRSIRRYYLLVSDWTQIPDAPLSEAEKALWQAYRQALRDIPQNYANYQDVVFPTPPEVTSG